MAKKHSCQIHFVSAADRKSPVLQCHLLLVANTTTVCYSTSVATSFCNGNSLFEQAWPI